MSPGAGRVYRLFGGYGVELRLLMLMLVFALSASCTAPTYDAQTDKMLTSVQLDVDQTLTKLISLRRQNTTPAIKAAQYAQNTSKYDEIDSSITAVELRMTAYGGPSSIKISDTFKQLRLLLETVRSTHEQTPGTVLSEPYLVGTRNQFRVIFQTLLTYEISKKTS